MTCHNFELKQGANYSFSIDYKNSDETIFDLTGYQAKLHVREDYNSTLLIELTSPTEIVLNILLGQITINFLPSHTVNLDRKKMKLIYDLEIYTNAENVIRLIEGNIIFSPEVTYP